MFNSIPFSTRSSGLPVIRRQVWHCLDKQASICVVMTVRSWIQSTILLEVINNWWSLPHLNSYHHEPTHIDFYGCPDCLVQHRSQILFVMFWYLAMGFNCHS